MKTNLFFIITALTLTLLSCVQSSTITAPAIVPVPEPATPTLEPTPTPIPDLTPTPESEVAKEAQIGEPVLLSDLENCPANMPSDLCVLPTVWNDDSKGSGAVGIITSVVTEGTRLNFDWSDVTGPMTIKWYITDTSVPGMPDYVFYANPGECYLGMMLTGDDTQYATVPCE